MSKSPDAFRTISEVADWLGVQAHVLRFWESRFSQVKPVKRAGGRRYYRPNDMRLLGGIKKLLHEDGITIKGVQRILREQGVAYVSSLSPSLDESAEPEKAPPDNVVVPFAAKPSPTGDQINLDLGEPAAPAASTPQPETAAEAPQQQPEKAAEAPQLETSPPEPEYMDEAPLLGGIATQAWERTDFDDDLLRRIAPIAKDLRAVINRIENRSAG
ncbi:MerR family transcriptional regulator [Ruegeria sp. Ofav3-42]|uniref:MerR family transcriptional regulator n=1 Tax=Ruegeria sp. Ofav3-42 TaxID=2917759 RepID=UPI001EF62043|nr:MerR family transcriptional regulator [Ruegeria sp. Ofav3-42]MCG7521181.1 MerR family transcriptional regulator [Ruegeria sp. Ofav3-42]